MLSFMSSVKKVKKNEEFLHCSDFFKRTLIAVQKFFDG